MRDDLNDVFCYLGELKETIDEVEVVKKFVNLLISIILPVLFILL